MRVLGANFVENLMLSSTETIRRCLDADTRLYHIGPTRCAVLLSATCATVWEAAARRLDLHLREPIDCDGIPVRAVPAIGVYTFRPADVKPRDVLRRLYNAAEDARDDGALTASYDPDHDRIHARRFQLLGSLSEALRADDQLALMFQPRVDLAGRPAPRRCCAGVTRTMVPSRPPNSCRSSKKPPISRNSRNGCWTMPWPRSRAGAAPDIS
jgi:GGDEF domain-containing protein